MRSPVDTVLGGPTDLLGGPTPRVAADTIGEATEIEPARRNAADNISGATELVTGASLREHSAITKPSPRLDMTEATPVRQHVTGSTVRQDLTPTPRPLENSISITSSTLRQDLTPTPRPREHTTGQTLRQDITGSTGRVAPDDLDGQTNLLNSEHLARTVGGDRSRLLNNINIHDEETYRPVKHKPRSTRPPSSPPPIPSTTRAPSPRRLAVGTLDGEAPVPLTLGGYTVTGQLASGGMGVVYRAEHPTVRRPVAIKVMHRQLQKNPEVMGRFYAESVATARIAHPNVVRLFDFGYDERGSAYLVMELLDGETLSARLAREGRIDVAGAVDIAIQVGLALAAAHQQGVVHRDVKPDNIFLTVNPASPGFPIVKLLDFGVAKVEGHSQGTMHTQQGNLLGTASYMAPEQGLSASDSDERSDIYSVGCVLYEMLCGVVPFTGNLVETLLAHQTSPRPAAHARNPQIPPALNALIHRLIARQPTDRPQTVNEMVRVLRAIKADDRFAVPRAPLMRRADTVVPGSRRWRGRWDRRRLRAALIALAVICGITAAEVVARGHTRAEANATARALITP